LAGLVLLGGVGVAEALTGLDGRYYPTYRPATIRWVQQALKATNAYAGPVNGKLDAATMEAIKGFQTRAGVHPSGVPTPLTRRALRAAAPSVKAPAEPVFQGVGTLTQQAGEVRITRANPPSRRRPQEFQRRIRTNDVVETGGNGRVVIALDDGSTMVLGNNTRVQVKDLVSAPAERETSVLVEASRGVLRFATRVVSDATTDIRVQAPTAFAAVRGTDWMMWIVPDTTSVFVEEGSVAVTNIGPNAKQVVVAQGQGTDVDRGKQPTDPAPWGYQRVMDLRKQTDYP
jgi:peptidoglycan hydrolase-like protein with peptidoglycan-binding domain